MELFKVTVKTDKVKKIELVKAMHAYSALRKVQQAPSGWHWEECAYKDRGRIWCAMVKGPDNKFTHFTLQDNG